MKPRKPDRFERMVLSRFERWRNAVGDTAQWHSKDVIKLLRREHAWMRRMVRCEMVSGETGTEGDVAYNQACLDILEQLAQRRK